MKWFKWLPWQKQIDRLQSELMQAKRESISLRAKAQEQSDLQELTIAKLRIEREQLPAHELALLRAAYKDVLTADQLRNALRGADQTDLFKAVLQVAAGMREQAILQGGGPGESADGRAYTDGEVNALDRLKRDLVARVQAANRD